MHGSQEYMQWSFKEWGGTVVMAGHDHTYERLIIEEFPYFVNGLGGRSKYSFGTPIPGSQVRYNDDYGAMLVEASQDSITFKFFSRTNDLIDVYTILNSITHVENNSAKIFLLNQNYPNPFNPTTKIKFQIPEFTFVRLTIYDIIGNEVRIIVDENKSAGTYEVDITANDLPSGIYFYTLRAGKYFDSKKMILLK